jgi:hypothetical protein
MEWARRFENYERETEYPAVFTVDDLGRAYAFWILGNDYRVKSEYYGGYPATYLKRIKALFPEKKSALHLFSGKVDTDIIPGDTVDINADLNPTFVGDAHTLLAVPLEKYDWVLIDPPYSAEDAEHYGTCMINRNTVMRTLSRCVPGTHLVFLDQVLPMYRKSEWDVQGYISIIKSTNHRFRVATIFCRREL